MKKRFITIIVVLLSIGLLSSPLVAKPVKTNKPDITVGIITPIAIPAMTEIVNGFKQQLNTLYPGHIHYIVQNAQGDINIQRAILQQYKAKKVDLVVPVGTAAAQMASSINTKQPIVALAAEFKDADRAKFKNKNITNIIDEIIISKQIKFIHAAFPTLKHITLIYSPDDHIFPQVKQASAAAKNYGITIQKLMIQGLPDLYTVSRQINKNSQAIFILKDALVVSGIDTLVKQAAHKKILLIASDDGSVKKGADFAIGVSESAIGMGGAELAAKVLNGTPASDIPVKLMTHYHVYVSPAYENTQLLKLEFAFSNVKKAAEKFGYPIETLKQLT